MRVLAVAFLITSSFAAHVNKQVAAASPVREQLHVDIGEAVLNVDAWGHGESVILLPDGGGSSSDYEQIGLAFATRGYRVFAVNFRGVRGSSGSLQGLTLHDYARDVARLIERVGGGRAHVLGAGLTSRVARCVAVDHPERVATLTLLAAGGKIPGDADAIAAVNRYFEDASMTREDLEKYAREALFPPGSDVSRFLTFRDLWPAARTAQGAASRATPVDDWWSGGRAPMLVIQGQLDRVAPVGNGRLLKDTYRDRVTLVELAGTGHMVFFERPSDVLHHAVEFWALHRTAAVR
jgi:pimeloyl-ACP methyl ester carboxylesterase